MKYKVGDVVKLRDDLDIGEEYGAVEFLYSMKTLKNKALRIDSIDAEYDECAVYEIEGWWISEEMIEGLWEECKEKQDKLKLIDVLNMIAKGELKEGTKVKYKNIEWEYKTFGKEGEKDLVDKANFTLFEQFYMDALSEEVELIEPSCEHEWKDIETHRMGEGIIRRFRRCNKCGLEEVTEERNVGADKMIEPAKIEELKYDVTDLDCLGIHNKTISLNIVDKLNEVIRMVNAITNLLN